MGALYATGDLWPRQDPLLHTTVLRPPVPHEWLFQVGLHGIRQVAGFPGLRIFHTLVVAGIGAFAFALFRRASGDLAAAALAAVVLFTLAWFRWMQLRPDVVTVAAIVALYALVLRSERPPGVGRLFAALALMLVWVNTHSLFAIGLCLVLAAALGTVLEAALGRACGIARAEPDANAARGRGLLLFLGLALVVTWANPRGFDQHLTFFTESEAGLIWKIRDDFLPYRPWSAPDAGPAFTTLAWWSCNLLYLAFFASALGRLLRLGRERSAAALRAFDAVHFGLGLAAFVASLVAVRFHWLALFPLLYLLRPLAARPLSVPWRGVLAALALAIAAALPVAAVMPAFTAEVTREAGGYWRSDWLDVRYCGPGARFLSDAGLEGRLYHPFNLGGFLGYSLTPRIQTFIDGRLDHVPAEVLDDYLTIRRTSRRGPTTPLRQRLDRWGIDLFFADSFPEPWYADRESGYHLRRLPEWIPIWVARSHAIYLRRNARNRANLARVAAYYAERGVPFDPVRGLDVARVIAEAPAFAQEQQLVLPKTAPLAERAEHAWRVGNFEEQVELDRKLYERAPEARDPALRLADGLLALGRNRRALAVLERLEAAHPADDEVAWLAARARAASPGAH